ncbi:twin-arginine translocase TatA/TatE family subunit [Schnuerera sp.]|nr:twin-arginine translocase TatA/TatE family subunit [Schnuerera sp.]HSH34979.1 twin-arginine translocase TatA/TatE family subunit [Schnuerera sp.]
MRLGWMEIILIVGIILLIFGPKRFRLIGKSAKDGVKEFKKEVSENKQEK